MKYTTLLLTIARSPLCFLIILLFPSCAIHYGSVPVGVAALGETKTPRKTYFAGTVGTDSRGVTQSAEGMTIAEELQGETMRSGIRTAGTIGTTSILAGVTENASNNATKEVIGGQQVTKSANAGKEATKQLKITTDGANQAAKIAKP